MLCVERTTVNLIIIYNLQYYKISISIYIISIILSVFLLFFTTTFSNNRFWLIFQHLKNMVRQCKCNKIESKGDCLLGIYFPLKKKNSYKLIEPIAKNLVCRYIYICIYIIMEMQLKFTRNRIIKSTNVLNPI